MQKYYLDSCIWRDYFENRSDKFRPLGDWAFELIKKIVREEGIIFYSSIVERELQKEFSDVDLKRMLSIVPGALLVKVKESELQSREACLFSKRYNLPVKDVLHAGLARDNGAIMVTRDKHFLEMTDIAHIEKPEDLL